MRWLLLIMLLVAVTPVVAQTPEAVPAPCERDAKGQVDYVACARAAPRGSQVRIWALINLGSQAVMRQDYVAAVQYYDEATPPGRAIHSDAAFHALRAEAYFHVGRKAEAFADAHAAALILTDHPDAPADIRARADRYGWDPEMAYGLILHILKEAQDPLFKAASARFAALPERGWQSFATRAVVFEKLGELDSALQLSSRALAAQPENPMVLNNHCYILVRNRRAEDALVHCRRAVELLPDTAAVRHSYASALAAAGKCDEARDALAMARRLDPVSATYKEDIACTPQL